MSDKILQLSDEAFENEVLKSDKPVLLDFWAPWCTPCRMFGAVLDQYVEEYDDVKVCKINFEEHKQVATKLNVMSIPTIYIFKNGEIVAQHIGALNKADLHEFVTSALNK